MVNKKITTTNKNKTKSKEKTAKSLKEALGITNLLSNEKTDFLLGLVLLAVSIFTLIAMVSYFRTGQADQSILENMRPGDWLNNTHSFTNYCGSLGAILCYWLMTINFGLAAFIIPFFMILTALYLMQIYRPNLWKWFFALSIIMIWASVVFAKFFTPILGMLTFNAGGKHGQYCIEQLENVVGTPGLIAIIIVTAITFLTFVSAETINFVRKMLNPAKYLQRAVKTSVIFGNSEKEHNEETVAEESATPKEEKLSPEMVTVVTPTEDGKEPVKTHIGNEDPVKKPADNPGFTVEVGKTEAIAHGNSTAEPDLSTPINPKEPFTKYKTPTISLLKKYDDQKLSVDMEEVKANNNRIIEVLNSFGVRIREIKATVGPTITLYEVTPDEGVRIMKIKNLEDDIAMNLAALGVRIIAPIPGKGTVGIEVPNRKPQIVSMESLINTEKFQKTKMDLPLALGKTITNEVFMVDLAKIPHLLVAGATGQGKSVGLNAIITSLLYKKHPNELKIVLVDPKKVEFSVYSPIADHFMASLPENDDEPIITDVTKVVRTLNSLCTLMDRRYDLLKLARVRNIKEYNEKFVNHQLKITDGHEYMPYIVVIIDEFGDLIMTAGRDIEHPIARIAQLARAVGIHMIIATQRPTTKIITGNIKANFPGRIAFRVGARIDSMTILDRTGADQLVGRGDMLYFNGNDPTRVQCAFVDTPEIENINTFIADQPGPVEPLELPEPATGDSDGGGIGAGGAEAIGKMDSLFREVARFVVNSQQGSTSNIQRSFEIGYNRAGRIMDQLEKVGIVGKAQGSKPRDVLIPDEASLNRLLEQITNA